METKETHNKDKKEEDEDRSGEKKYQKHRIEKGRKRTDGETKENESRARIKRDKSDTKEIE